MPSMGGLLITQQTRKQASPRHNFNVYTKLHGVDPTFAGAWAVCTSWVCPAAHGLERDTTSAGGQDSFIAAQAHLHTLCQGRMLVARSIPWSVNLHVHVLGTYGGMQMLWRQRHYPGCERPIADCDSAHHPLVCEA